jgi:hypothetical protein
MTKDFAAAFAKSWIDSWNAHDLEKILSHYSEDFTIESPLAIKLYPQSNGLVVGKNEVRKYWTIGLEKSPNLKFELLDLYQFQLGCTIYHLLKVEALPACSL